MNIMSKYDYDLIVIGGGSAGLIGAKFAASLGKKVLLVEKNILGGDCLLYGCVPSKALISMNKVLHSPFLKTLNLSLNRDKKIDFKLVKQDIKETITEVGEGDSEAKLNEAGVEVLIGTASFINTNKLKVGDKEISSKYFLVATGSHPFVPEIKGLDQIKYYTNETIFDIDELPDSMVVLGGGPIGCELSQAFSNLGSKVTIIQRNKSLIPNDDISASEFLKSKFLEEGIDIKFEDEIIEVQKLESGMTKVILKSGHEIETDLLLISIGRKPNATNMSLDNAQVTSSDKGISVNDYLQTSTKNIFAAGDVAGPFLFTHFAAHQASAAVLNMFLPFFMKQKFYTDNIPWVTFVNPEISHCGKTENQLVEQNINYSIIEMPFGRIDRAITEKSRDGFIRIYKSESDTVLGAVIAGERAGELIMECIIAMANGIKISKLVTIMHPYPTFSSGMQTVMYEDYLKNSKVIKLLKRFI